MNFLEKVVFAVSQAILCVLMVAGMLAIAVGLRLALEAVFF
jgi:hypothetical protein